jgi:hypothetical protein
MLVVIAILTCAMRIPSQQPPTNGQPSGVPPNGGGRAPIVPTKTDRYQSSWVKLGDNLTDGLMYEPVKLGANPHVALVSAYDPPAVELANRGYRALYVRHQSKPGAVPFPLDGGEEVSKGIAYLRTLPGVQHVVVVGWGTTAIMVTLYADVAENGPVACQKDKLVPCKTDQATHLAKPDGVILLDTGSGSGNKAMDTDPGYVGNSRTLPDLDMFSAANGYDVQTGTATYSAAFRKKYYAAQTERNEEIIKEAMARLKVLDATGGGDEPIFVAGAVNAGASASLFHADLSIVSHTKKPHTLLKADGTKPEVILESIRPTMSPIGDEAITRLEAQNLKPARPTYTLRQYLANDAVHTIKDFAVTDDDIIGVDWKSSNEGTPAQAEGITVPALVMTNTCFMFVVPSEMTYDHLASKDKTFAGVEGSEHFFTPCGPQYGDTKKRLFDFVDGWLAKPGRF